MRRSTATAALAVIVMLLASVSAYAQKPALTATSAFLLDGATDQVLLAADAEKRVYPASTTKLLTALVAVQRGQLDHVIKVSARAANPGAGSTLCGITAGEEDTLEDLLYGLLLPSGNDCANAIAEGLTGGRIDLFVSWMNDLAAELGARNSSFVNAHGLHDPEHYTTAHDMALIAKAALSNPVVARIAATTSYQVPGKPGRVYRNGNDLLTTYPGAAGGKTGWTEDAGYCLVGSVRRNGRYLIAVVMGERDRTAAFQDVRALLDYGLSDMPAERPAQASPTASPANGTAAPPAESQSAATAPPPAAGTGVVANWAALTALLSGVLLAGWGLRRLLPPTASGPPEDPSPSPSQ